jgi:hypothetical protein
LLHEAPNTKEYGLLHTAGKTASKLFPLINTI